MSLPIEPFLGEIRRQVREKGQLILSAAPGAGKTSCVPGALLEEFPGHHIIMLEPRRVAATAAAVRISELLNTPLGEKAGFVVRGERCISSDACITVMTPGVLLRKIQADPALEDTDIVIFDEFHERSAECDLLLALLLESRKALRDDLKLVIMSATLDSGRLKEMLGTDRCLEVPGREFPVEQLWSDHLCPRERIPEETAGAALAMLKKSEGNMLVFLPGVGEIKRCAALMEGKTPENVIVEELHGSLALHEQTAVLKKAPGGFRKVILSTNVAESSLTADNVRCVIDSGYERVPKYDPGSGLTRLETLPVSRASAAQRSGRAGRVAPGVALRLWESSSHGGRREFALPEICDCDLTSFALELALWGAAPDDLEWVDPPPQGAYNEGCSLLRELGVLDSSGRISDLGRNICRFPVHPRLGAMLERGKELGGSMLAVEIAALLENRSDNTFPAGADIMLHLEHLRRNMKKYRSHKMLIEQLKNIASDRIRNGNCCEAGEILLAAFPDRIARLRRKNGISYTMKNGRGCKLAEDDPLRGSEFLVVAAISGDGRGDGTIRLAAHIDRETVQKHIAGSTEEKRICIFDGESGRAKTLKQTLFGGIIISETPVEPENGELAAAVLECAVKRGIPIIPQEDKAGHALWERLKFAHRMEPERFPCPDEKLLIMEAAGFFSGLKGLNQIEKLQWMPVLRALLGHSLLVQLDEAYPEKFRTPAGAEHRIDYSGNVPMLSVRLQEMLGVKKHPAVGVQQIPLKIELLSPALRPIQTTSDLPGFWNGSYGMVRKEMKARYPKHEWPEDPAAAGAMLRSVKSPGRK